MGRFPSLPLTISRSNAFSGVNDSKLKVHPLRPRRDTRDAPLPRKLLSRPSAFHAKEFRSANSDIGMWDRLRVRQLSEIYQKDGDIPSCIRRMFVSLHPAFIHHFRIGTRIPSGPSLKSTEPEGIARPPGTTNSRVGFTKYPAPFGKLSAVCPPSRKCTNDGEVSALVGSLGDIPWSGNSTPKTSP